MKYQRENERETESEINFNQIKATNIKKKKNVNESESESEAENVNSKKKIKVKMIQQTSSPVKQITLENCSVLSKRLQIKTEGLIFEIVHMISDKIPLHSI